MDNSKKGKSKVKIRQVNVLESLKDIGASSGSSLKKDVVQGASSEFLKQLLGRRPQEKLSGEIAPGESLEFSDIYTGRQKEALKLKNQLKLEHQLREEERVRTEKKSNELKIQLNVIIQEVVELAKSTQGLAEEVQIASMQAPVEPGVYHVIFFEKLLEFVKSFRKKIEDAAVWLHATNSRAEKKNYWSRYKKHGGKFLLAADHYLTRSAG